MQTLKFRMYPTKEQETKLFFTLNKCRRLYNLFLKKKQDKERKWRKSELQALLPEMKREYPELKNVHSKTLQYVMWQLCANLKALHQLKQNGKKVGRLRFKSRDKYKTFVYNQSGFKIIRNDTRYDKLHLSKIGDIPLIVHREIAGKIKQVIIKHYPSGKWYASIQVDDSDAEYPQTISEKKVGIDLGIENYIYDSDKNQIDHPKMFTKSLKKLRRAQRLLSRKKKGSCNRTKQRVKVVRIHEKVVNQRDDFLHKLSHFYACNYGLVAVENLNVRGLIGISYNAKNIMDASWSRFIQMLCYKAERAGSRVVKVEPRGTTQECSNCGETVHKELWHRTHSCSCGFVADRDYNSAINILQKALLSERQEYTPVERRPLLVETQASSLREAGSHNLNPRG